MFRNAPLTGLDSVDGPSLDRSSVDRVVTEPPRGLGNRLAKAVTFGGVGLATVAATSQSALAQYTAVEPSIPSLFDWSGLSDNLLTAIGTPYGVIAGIMIAVGIGWSVVRKAGGRHVTR